MAEYLIGDECEKRRFEDIVVPIDDLRRRFDNPEGILGIAFFHRVQRVSGARRAFFAEHVAPGIPRTARCVASAGGIQRGDSNFARAVVALTELPM